jgi:transposase InsO family protein
MQRLHQHQQIPPNKASSSLCHACQLGRHIRLPFYPSESISVKPFQLLHCDLWTSPIPSTSGFGYYLIIVDDYTHYFWTFPLRKKSDVFLTFTAFHAYARTQFNLPILAIQCDNGREFDNKQVHSFFTKHGTLFRFSCPHTSQQNGKAERAIRTTNNVIRTLLFQASMPPSLWAEALHTATFLINIRPTNAQTLTTPYELLFGLTPSYHTLRVFGCLCYPNITSTTPNKLSPRSTRCVFLGYPSRHKGYRCLDLATRRIIISRHVIFDEHTFPYAPDTPVQPSPPPTPDLFDPIDSPPLPVPSVTSQEFQNKTNEFH